MKRYIKTAYVISFVALALASCSKAEEFQYNPDSALQIESVSGISPFSLMQEPATKAVITGDSLPGDEAAKGIGLFVTATGGGAYDGHDKGYTNVKYTFDGSKWSTQSPIYLSDNDGNLYGYFPYNADATDLHAIPVESSLNGTDYLYANPMTVNHSEKNVTLQMNHALSRLHLTIKKGENFTADASLSKITLKSAAIDATGTMDLTDGTITPSKKSGETGIVEVATDGEITAQGIEKDILIVPTDNSEGKKDIAIFLTIDNKATGASLSGESGLDIRSGIQNNVTLTIEDTGIKVSGVDVGVWGEGGSQSAKVDGYTVTVKLSDDAADAGISGDVLSLLQVNGSDLSIDTYSKMGKPVVLRMNGTSLGPDTESGNLCTFTISDITSDITATLAYAKTRTVTFNMKVDKAPNVSGYVYGKAESITVLEGRPSILTAIPGEGYAFDYFNVKGTKYGDKAEVVIPNGVETIDAYFRFTDWLGGVFSVGENTKVRFSRGNLWCDGTDTGYSDAIPKIKSWGFESKQYESTPSSNEDRTISHISHFMWCKSAEESVKEKYSETGTAATDNLFTNASPTKPNVNFAINGQQGFWRALSGKTGGEWEYLINRNGGTLYKLGVTVCGSADCLILLPDDWEWDANTVGTGWQTEYSESTDVKWSTMEAAGAVCLPAAGYRSGTNEGSAYVLYVGYKGGYWSSTPYSGYAYYLVFNSSEVGPARNDNRSTAYAIRLVTEEGSPAPSVVPVESVSLDKTAATLDVNGTVTLSATVLPDNATDKSVSWSSNNTGVATVDASGKVTAVAAGTATITVTTTDGGKTATCTVTVYDLPDGALPGKFSVSATKKVYFSRGNLYADGGNALHFESNQYSFVSSEEATHVSYFTWSSTVEKAVGKSNDGDFLFCNESNKQSVDGSGKIYYALSKDEWTYLFNNHSKKWVTVNGFNGYAIAPDGFTGTIASTYADDAALAADNLVFLPAAGKSGMLINSNCYYWSSNNDGKQAAYGLSLNSINPKTDYSTFRDERLSVRLVADCK